MNIELKEIQRADNELMFSIIDKDTNNDIGFLFTIDNHIAYEIYPEYRCQGAATHALKLITSKINRPVLEIKYDNVASKKVALKAGYVLMVMENEFEIYEFLEKNIRVK